MIKHIVLISCFLLLLNCNTQKKELKVAEYREVSATGSTNIVLALEQEIDPNKNQLYCATLGYAWNEARQRFNDDITISPQNNQLALLDSTRAYKNSLADNEIENSVEIKGNVTNINSKFELLLPFNKPYIKNNSDLSFLGTPVESFGVSPESEREIINEQTQLLFYEDETTFAVKLQPENPDHEIILYTAQGLKQKSLKVMLNHFETKQAFHAPIERTHKNKRSYFFFSEDVLSIPVIKIDHKKTFSSLIKNQFLAMGNTHSIENVSQSISLSLNEKGAEVKSEAEIQIVSLSAQPAPKHIVFNKPFLMLLKRKDSKNPYLVAWINNADLLVKKEIIN